MPIVSELPPTRFDSTEHIASSCSTCRPSTCIRAFANPTCDAVEKKIAALEGGVGAMLHLLRPGGEPAGRSEHRLGGGQLRLRPRPSTAAPSTCLPSRSSGWASRCTFVDPRGHGRGNHTPCSTAEHHGWCLAKRWPTPPLLVLRYREACAGIAHAHGVPLVVDNTFPTPVLCRPFEFGCGHRHPLHHQVHGRPRQRRWAACIVDSGNFDWADSGQVSRACTEPDESYHGVVYTESFGRAAYITKARVQLMRDFGCTPQPIAAFLLNLGLETLAVRMERHCQNAAGRGRIPGKARPRWRWVNYPGLAGHARSTRWRRSICRKGVCGVISFGVKGGREAAMKFMDSLELAADRGPCGRHRAPACCTRPAPPTASSPTSSSWPRASRPGPCAGFGRLRKCGGHYRGP